jgi:hypothetical protein
MHHNHLLFYIDVLLSIFPNLVSDFLVITYSLLTHPSVVRDLMFQNYFVKLKQQRIVHMVINSV